MGRDVGEEFTSDLSCAGDNREFNIFRHAFHSTKHVFTRGQSRDVIVRLSLDCLQRTCKSMLQVFTKFCDLLSAYRDE